MPPEGGGSPAYPGPLTTQQGAVSVYGGSMLCNTACLADLEEP